MSNNIPDNLKTPGTYFQVNTNTQRSGLPANRHRILFVTDDDLNPESNPEVATVIPIDIYDKAQADARFGLDSIAGRMITAAIKTNRTVDVQCLGKGQTVTAPEQV